MHIRIPIAFVLLFAPSPALAQSLDVFPSQFELNGLHEGRQLLVTGAAKDDLTRSAVYSAAPANIVRVSTQGYVRPVGKGTATIRVEAKGQVREVKVTVADFDETKPLNFVNDIEPILSRHGCNAGGCHGRASGQNGFKLSLFGFDPAFDYNAIVKEARGRRVFPSSPDNSLILTKASGMVAHGGGRRLPEETEDYRTLRRWILQGAPLGDDRAATLQKLSIVPDQRVMQRKQEQQVAVLAHYTDGIVRDVTKQAQFQSNEIAVAAVDADGIVRSFELAGDATVMARYQGQVAVFRALVPLGKPIAKYPDFPANNYIDTLALARWKKLDIVPSELCSDSEFIRRVTVDLCGRLPTVEETKAFLADTTATKRSKLIDRLLDSRDYAAYFAMRWGSVLRNASLAGSEQAAYAFHEWIRDHIARNRPYDEFVRGIVAAAGEWQDAPAVNWYWQMRDDQLHQPVADTAQVFLGLRLQCAKCHHHPYERWSQNDYYGLAGFFSRLGRKGLGEPPPYYASRTRTTGEINPATLKPIEPKLLDGPVLKVPPEDDPRHRLVDWMAEPGNPFFAKALVNRMWGHLMGRGLVDPIDDMRETNPPSNPELLDALAKDFIKSKLDVKHVLRTICNSRTYQLSSEPNEFNQHDKQNHARSYARRMIAEVLHDAIDQVTDTQTRFDKMSKNARAVDLPHEGFGSYFLDVFDRPPRSSACECARSSSANLPQVLHLSMSPALEAKIANGKGRVARLMERKVSIADAVTELYLAAYARVPTDAERDRTVRYVQDQKDVRLGLEDLGWALMNTRAFMYNH
ncbi:MAG: DUF1549 domain-containing protein [Planctomycetes bacterium]|nr:DUF1549 domain-containing protein [Planctomycetota bacterium]